ncbi:MAG: BamA/TamA family outer membrane protein [Balneola sp.]
MSKRLSYLFKGAVLLLLFCSAELSAQKPQNVVVTDSIETAFLPALSFNSDFGFLLGGLVHRFHYKKDTEPFHSFTQVAAIVSTKGLLSGLFEYDKPYAFSSNNRFISQIYASRFLQDTYYGIGSYQKIEDSFNSNNKFYSFQSFSFGVDARLRIPLRVKNKSSINVLAILNFDYTTPVDNGPDRLITQEQPQGVDGGQTLHLGTGFILESRNSEFRPTHGSYIETTAEVGQTWFGSSYNTFIFQADIRKYTSFYLLKEITWANRLFTKNTSGEVPYWKMAYAGDEESLRGYPSSRFLDDNVILFNTELRTWLFNIDAIGGEFGGTLFFDVGRTYPNGESFDTIFNDLKYSYGLGGTSSFFTPDFVLRCDVGFSEEGVGVYFTAGYMF